MLTSLGIGGARLQSENRLRLSDVVANLGYNVNGHSRREFLILHLPPNIAERKAEKPIRFLRRQYPASPSFSSASKREQSENIDLTMILSFKVETFDHPFNF